MLQFYHFKRNEIKSETLLYDNQHFKKEEGLEFSIAIDAWQSELMTIDESEEKPDWKYAKWWMESVVDHIKKSVSTHRNLKKKI